MTQVKVRKDHECAQCGQVIKRGELAEYGEARYSRLDSDWETQIGIKYAKWWLCLPGECLPFEEDEEPENQHTTNATSGAIACPSEH